MTGEPLEALSHPEYWDKRYSAINPDVESADGVETSPAIYEWYRAFDELRPFFERHLPAPSFAPRILHLGCGNSALTADLHALGYKNQISVDWSTVVIARMKAAYASLTGLEWRVMDIRRLQLPDDSIDLAIDKVTLDGMIHGSVWDPPPEVRENVGAYVDEVSRTLRPGGVWLYITFRQPHFMKPFLTREDVWDLTVESLTDQTAGGGGILEYFAFVMTKKIHR